MALLLCAAVLPAARAAAPAPGTPHWHGARCLPRGPFDLVGVHFTQTVVDSRGKRVGTGRGRLIIVRPGRFRWESAPEGADDAVQLLVADGRNLWFFDRDLEQATVKPQQEALPQSPAMLLAGGADLRAAFSMQRGRPARRPRLGHGAAEGRAIGFPRGAIRLPGR